MIGIIGGTGPQGKGLALRLAIEGVDIMVGSRRTEKGEGVAAELTETLAGRDGVGSITGGANGDLPATVDTLLVAIPYEGVADTLAPLAAAVDGHVVMSAVNALSFKGGPHPIALEAGSCAQQIAGLLPGARVTTAFNNVSANHLLDLDHTFDEDVLVCGDDADAVTATVELADRVTGLRGVRCGPLRLAGTVEAMTAVVICVNKAYKVTAGVRITGLR